MIRILIADDHPIVRRGIRDILSESLDIGATDEASHGQEALRMIHDNNYDLVLLDIAMPGRNGLEVLKDIKREKPGLPVLVLSVYPEEQYAIRALKAGASGYLTKESAPEELIKAIWKACRGGKYVTSSLAEKLASNLDDLGKPPHETLSEREYQVLLMIASGKSLTEIAEELFLSVKTVSTYRSRLLDKMDMKSNAELARYILENHLAL